MANLVTRYDADVKNAGDTIHVPNVSAITATYKVQGTDVSPTATTETANTISIDKHAVAPVKIEDIATIQSSYNLRSIYTTQLGKAIASITDTDIRNLYSGFSQTVGAGATSSDLALAKTYILEAVRKLNAANAPFTDRNMVVESYGYKDLLNTDDFVRYDAVGQADGKNATISAKIGKLYGVDIYQTEQVYTLSSVAYGMVFQKEAMALAMQKSLRVQAQYKAESLANLVVADSLYGVAELRDDHGVCIRYGQT